MIEWTWDTAPYSNGEYGCLGKYRVFNIYWNAARPQGSTNKNDYKLTCKLPGIKSELGEFETQEKAKAYATRVLQVWLIDAGLQLKVNVSIAPLVAEGQHSASGPVFVPLSPVQLTDFKAFCNDETRYSKALANSELDWKWSNLNIIQKLGFYGFESGVILNNKLGYMVASGDDK